MTKKLYIYGYVAPVTDNYHSGGGLVIVTAGDPTAAWLASDDYARVAQENEEDEGVADLSEPTRVIDVADSEPDAVYVFQDAGCC